MFAIIRTGGKQYKVARNEKIWVEKLEVQPGSEVILDKVLMIGTEAESLVGSPLLEKAQVIALVEEQMRSDKVIIFKKRRRHNYRRKKGHRQHQTVLRIIDILKDSSQPRTVESAVSKAEKAPKAVKETAVVKETVEKAPKKKAASSKAE